MSILHPVTHIRKKEVKSMDSGVLTKVVAVGVGLFVAAILLPTALATLANSSAQMVNVNDSVVTIVQVLLPTLGVIAIAIYMLRGD